MAASEITKNKSPIFLNFEFLSSLIFDLRWWHFRIKEVITHNILKSGF